MLRHEGQPPPAPLSRSSPRDDGCQPAPRHRSNCDSKIRTRDDARSTHNLPRSFGPVRPPMAPASSFAPGECSSVSSTSLGKPCTTTISTSRRATVASDCVRIRSNPPRGDSDDCTLSMRGVDSAIDWFGPMQSSKPQFECTSCDQLPSLLPRTGHMAGARVVGVAVAKVASSWLPAARLPFSCRVAGVVIR